MLQLTAVQKILSDLDETQAEREKQYKYFHQHPELSIKEDHTAQTIIDILSKAGIETKRVGKTGVVAEIKNGEGPVVAKKIQEKITLQQLVRKTKMAKRLEFHTLAVTIFIFPAYLAP